MSESECNRGNFVSELWRQHDLRISKMRIMERLWAVRSASADDSSATSGEKLAMSEQAPTLREVELNQLDEDSECGTDTKYATSDDTWTMLNDSRAE
jgi:hypothetical protein